jgi:hypothetical protein
MGHDDRRLRGRRLYGVSPEVKASFDRRLIRINENDV